MPVEHHHIDSIAHGHVALGMAQQDQAVGLYHGAEHAPALVAGDADLQLTRCVGADNPNGQEIQPHEDDYGLGFGHHRPSGCACLSACSGPVARDLSV